MRWQHTWGRHAEKLLAAHKNPSEASFVKQAPTLTDFEVYYADAFLTLSNSREVGFGIGPIKISEIAAYLTIFPAYDADMFVSLIQAMDAEYLELQVSERNGRTSKT